jgi:FG-GAP repeat
MSRVSWRLLVGVLAVILAPLAAHDAASAAVVKPIRYDDSALASVGQATWRDFNGDGRADLAIGAPYDDVDGKAFAGVVHVLYGTDSGLTTTGNEVWSQGTTGIQGTPEFGDHFGWALTSADFNVDGYGDLAIGVPLEDVPVEGGFNVVDAGAVQVLYGSKNGLTAVGDVLISSTDIEIEPNEAAGYEFGTALAALDSFHGMDGTPDLAVGAPGSFYLSVIDGGSFPPESLDLVATAIGGVSTTLGAALVAGDFDSNGQDDLAVGNPTEGDASEGSVEVLLNGGPSDSGSWISVHDGGQFDFRGNDHVGRVLGARDLDGDGLDELVIGVPDRDVNGLVDAGEVWILPSSPTGPNENATQFVSLLTSGFPGSPVAGDRFGAAMAMGRFNAGNNMDLAIGIPGRNVAGKNNAGVVMVRYDGSSTVGVLSQDTTGIEGIAETNDSFGAALSSAEWGNGGRADLAVGVPREGISGQPSAGVVHVIYGSPNGMSATNSELWHQDIPRVGEVAENLDRFGLSLR